MKGTTSFLRRSSDGIKFARDPRHIHRNSVVIPCANESFTFEFLDFLVGGNEGKTLDQLVLYRAVLFDLF